MKRRSVARFVRARQELLKRAEYWLPPPVWQSPEDTANCLLPEIVNQASRDLRAFFASRSGARFPIAHLSTRVPATLPDADQILAEAQAILQEGALVFGLPARAFRSTGDWRADPVSGMNTSLDHWTRMQFVPTNGSDIKHIWELNRHHGTVRLAQAYFLTGRQDLAEHAVGLVDSWMRQNPPRLGINWTSSLEVSYRAIAFSWVWQLTRNSAAWTAERMDLFIWHLWHHAYYIEQYQFDPSQSQHASDRRGTGARLSRKDFL